MEGNAMRDTIITNEALYKYKNSAGLRAKNKEAEKQMSLFFSSLTLRSPLLFPTLAKPNKKLKDKEGRRRGRERGPGNSTQKNKDVEVGKNEAPSRMGSKHNACEEVQQLEGETGKVN